MRICHASKASGQHSKSRWNATPDAIAREGTKAGCLPVLRDHLARWSSNVRSLELAVQLRSS